MTKTPILICNNCSNCNSWHAEFAAFAAKSAISFCISAKDYRLQTELACRRHRRRQIFIATAADFYGTKLLLPLTKLLPILPTTNCFAAYGVNCPKCRDDKDAIADTKWF